MPIITGFLSKINKKIIIAVIMVFIVSIFIVLIAAKDSEIHKKEKEIAQYQEDIKGLELNNQTLQNEILFIKENEKFQNSFSNSSLMIKNIDEELLTRTENETFNSISNNFYKYFFYNKRFKNSPKLQTVPDETVCARFFRSYINFMQYKNKICQSTAFYASRNIYYKSCYKQTRFNEKIPRKYYKDRRMAIMV
ncbi:VSH-1 phage-like protein [Brachyspira sp. G79]|nr:VSH-1 phage-like protein [Brachyspira sp. G79]